MISREIRQLFAPQNPFLLGRYPGRLAPAHLMNGFVGAALGTSERGERVRQLLSAGSQGVDHVQLPSGIPFVDSAPWARDADRFPVLCGDLAHVFNPDGRMWEEFGSLSVIHASLAVGNPGDDGLGASLWDLVRRHGPRDCRKRLEAQLFPRQAHDPITATALVLVKDSPDSKTRDPLEYAKAWYGPDATPAADLVATELSGLLSALVSPSDEARRLQGIQHLTRGVQLAAILAIILGPIAARIRKPVTSVHEVAALIVWGGIPPGPPDQAVVRASQRHLNQIAERLKRALGETLREGIAAHRLPRGLPTAQRRRELLLRQYQDAGRTVPEANRLLARLADDTKLPINSSDPPDDRWCRRLLEHAYGGNDLAYGLRQMGRKVGFIGPDRGQGRPRFVCETPLLGTLVAALCPLGGMDFEAFVDAARSRLGLVFGPGTEDDLAEELGLWEGGGTGRARLRENQEELRVRLIRSGLAREYSDGYTEVRYGG